MEIKESEISGVILSGGEPTLNPCLVDFLQMIKDLNIYILLDSNGVCWEDKFFKVVAMIPNLIPRISLDSSIPDIHNTVRGGFQSTYNTIDKLVTYKDNVRINTVLNLTNYRYMSELADLLVKWNIKRWHIYKLRKQYAPKKYWISDELTEVILRDLFKWYGDKIDITCKFSNSDDDYASFLVDGCGECFTERNGKKVIWGNISNDHIRQIWANTPSDYKIRHFKKYFKRNNHISYN